MGVCDLSREVLCLVATSTVEQGFGRFFGLAVYGPMGWWPSMFCTQSTYTQWSRIESAETADRKSREWHHEACGSHVAGLASGAEAMHGSTRSVSIVAVKPFHQPCSTPRCYKPQLINFSFSLSPPPRM